MTKWITQSKKAVECQNYQNPDISGTGDSDTVSNERVNVEVLFYFLVVEEVMLTY